MDDSPLKGKLTVGDVLVSLDNMPAASMKESTFTEYVVANAGRERAFVVSTQPKASEIPVLPSPRNAK